MSVYIVLNLPADNATQDDADILLRAIQSIGFSTDLEIATRNMKPFVSEAGASVNSIQDAILRGKGVIIDD